MGRSGGAGVGLVGLEGRSEVGGCVGSRRGGRVSS